MKTVMEGVKRVYQQAEPYLTLLGWMGGFGFPTYYFIWTVLYPQPYENFLLRACCSFLMFVLLIRHRLPHSIQVFLPYYYLFLITVCLPFFFIFMMFMNSWSTVWAMSFMSSIFLHILLVHEPKIMIVQTIIASILAFMLSYGFKADMTDRDLSIVWQYIPVFMFTYVFGALFYFRNIVENEQKILIAKASGASIAHEMRTPLSAIKSAFDIIQPLLIKLGPDTRNHINLTRIYDIIKSSYTLLENTDETIDLILTSIQNNRIKRSTFKYYAAEKVIHESLKSYFADDYNYEEYVKFRNLNGFEYFGSDTLLKHVIFNLLKNSLHYRVNNKFTITITITVSTSSDENIIYFEDNGDGIGFEKLTYIFEDFYTSGKVLGNGLGLPFCKRVMTSFGGSISCESELGKWTKFTMKFPHSNSSVIGAIKNDIAISKKLLYLGNDSELLSQLRETKCCQVESLSIDQVRAIYKYSCQYDLTFIELDFYSRLQEFEYGKLYKKLGKVILCDENEFSNEKKINSSLHRVYKEKLLKNTPAVIYDFVFGNHMDTYSSLPDNIYFMNRQILVVDDNNSIREMIGILLKSYGCKVFQASNGSQALKLLSKVPIDLILLDLEMPIINGYVTANIIRESNESYSSIPILACTGDTRPETIQKITEVGIDSYIPKPVDKDHLLDKLSTYLM